MRSILFFDKEGEVLCARTVRDLALDRTVSLMHSGKEGEALALRILQTPCTDPTVIAARQAVLRNFIACPEALDKLMSLCRRITEEAEERRAARYRMARSAHGTDQSGRLLAVQDDGEWLLMILQQYARLSRYLNTLPLCARPLLALQREIAAIVADDAYGRLCEDMAAFAAMRTRNTSYVVQAEMTEDLRYVTYCLARVAERMTLHSTVDDPSRIVRLSRAEQLYAEHSVTTALRSLHDYLLQAARVLTAPLEQLAEELLFYDFGVRYYRLLQDKKAPIVWPTVTAEGETVYRGLRDIHLTLHETKLPLANDYRQAPLVIITGANNSGKTVLMRAVATAQLFAQAGLPLPAKAATVRVRRRVLSLYAAEERDTGRFEEECRLLSDIADTVTSDDMVLFNEPFQSTSYHEAGVLLAEVIGIFAKAAVPMVLVTHLLALKEELCALPPCAVRSYTAACPYVFTVET